MVQVGIFGAGFIAQAHAAAYAACPGVELAVIADPRFDRAQQLAQRYNATAVEHLDHLLASNVNAVSVCTPTPTHAEIAIAAMRAGKHVLCEKPMARSLAEAEAMIAAADSTGMTLMVGHVTRYESDHQQAKAIVDRGDIGAVRMMSQSLTGPFPEWSSGGWFANVEQSGGPVIDLAIHCFDTLLWFFGATPTRVTAMGAKRKIDLNTYVLVTLNFADGGLGLVETSWAHPRGQGLTLRTEIMGRHGRMAWTYDDITSMYIIRGDAPRQNTVMPNANPFGAEIAAFVQAIEQNTAPPIPGKQGLEALRVALAAHESLETGRPITLHPQ